MSSKKRSHRKKDNYIKTNDSDNTEIFVLPPNLLEKLGIHLENVAKESPNEPTTKKDIISTIDQSCISKDVDIKSDVTSTHVKSNTHNCKETSILETASLMKNSVFLSPTFLATIGNVIPGEIEIAKNFDERKNNNTLELLKQSNIISPVLDVPGEVINNNIIQIKDSNAEVHSSINKPEYTEATTSIKEGLKSNQICNDNKNPKLIIVMENPTLNINDICLEKKEENLSPEDNHIKAFPFQTADLLRTNIESNSKLTNKINILSEEILAPSQLKNIRKLCTPNTNSLIPVTINSLITCKKNNNNPITNVAIHTDINEVLNTNVDILIEPVTDDQDLEIVFKEECSNALKRVDIPNSDSLNPIEIKKTFINNNVIEDFTIREHNTVEMVEDINKVINDDESNIVYEEKNLIPYSNISSKVDDVSVDDDIINNIQTLIPVDTINCENDNKYTNILLNDISNLGELKLSENNDYQLQEVNISNNKDIICTDNDNIVKDHTFDLKLQNDGAVIKDINGKVTIGEECSEMVFNYNTKSTLLNYSPVSREVIEGQTYINEHEEHENDDKILLNKFVNKTALIEYGKNDNFDDKVDIIFAHNNNKLNFSKPSNSVVQEINNPVISIENNVSEDCVIKSNLENEVLVKKKDNENFMIRGDYMNIEFVNDDSKSSLPKTLLSSLQVLEVEIYNNKNDNTENKITKSKILKKDLQNETSLIEKESDKAREIVFMNNDHKLNLSKPSLSSAQKKNETYNKKVDIDTEEIVKEDHTFGVDSVNGIYRFDNDELHNENNRNFNTILENMQIEQKQPIDQIQISDTENNFSGITENSKDVEDILKTPINTNLSDQNKNNCFPEAIQSQSKDVIQEIASYLSQYSELFTRRHKLIKKKQSNNDVKSKVSSIKSGITKSKLCIQGVEKPGGFKQGFRNYQKMDMHKTYNKKVQHKKTHLQFALKRHDNKVYENSKYNPEHIDCVNTSDRESKLTKQEFCICGDFGRLAYYDDFINLYEHIHFWSHPKINCNLDTMMNIYNYDSNILNSLNVHSEDDSLELAQDIDTTEINCYEEDIIRICHENFTISNDFSVIEVEANNVCPKSQSVGNAENISESILQINKTSNIKPNVEEVITKSKDNDYGDCTETPAADISKIYQHQSHLESNLNGGIDSRNLNFNEVFTVTTEVINEPVNQMPLCDSEFISNSKSDNVRVNSKTGGVSNEGLDKVYCKCGVCDKMIDDKKWENHVAKEHCYIAWKVGDTFNYEELDLKKKLKKRLNIDGYLKCDHCDTKIKKTNKFLLHVKSCFNLENSKSHEVIKNQDNSNTDSSSTTSLVEEKHECLEKNKDSIQTRIYEIQNGRLSDESTPDKFGNKSENEANSDCNSGVSTSVEHQPKRGGRKRRMDTDVADENVRKKCRNTVKCAVCEQMVLETEWKDHVSENHNYVAWKNGEVFDYEDPAVYKKLKKKMKCQGFLTCFNCDIEIKYTKSFLKHAQKCIVTKNVIDMSNLKKEPVSKVAELITCGVCMQEVKEPSWVEHISGQHHYLAWKHGEPPLDLKDEDSLKHHLVDMVQKHGGLMCVKCGLFRKYVLKTVKSYLAHIKKCGTNDSLNCTEVIETSNTSNNETNESTIQTTDGSVVTCAVCKESLPSSHWIEHSCKQHNYLAWKVGDENPNLEDEESMRQHLYNIAKRENGLICSNCGLVRKYVKSYLHHIKSCDGMDTARTDESQLDVSTKNTSINVLEVKGDVECGVCNTIIEDGHWITHIQQKHRYMAWINGQPPLDLNNPDVVYDHLFGILKLTGSLTCNMCGTVRKYVKKYLQHVESCISSFGSDISTLLNEEGMFQCAVCSEKVYPHSWKSHAMKKHYNVAWVVGGTPIDLTSTYGAERYLKEYKDNYGKLVCKTCGSTRASCMGFYAHIITCGKTDEETEMFKSMCDICNSKYICIYKSQHMAMHREQEYAKERKKKSLEAKEREEEEEEKESLKLLVNSTGQRIAAVKAKTVIENYKKSNEYRYNCPDCNFGTDDEVKLSRHKCDKNSLQQFSDSELVKLDESDEESIESEVDSDVSLEEEQANKRIRRNADTSASSKIPRIPFTIKSVKSYLEDSYKDYTNLILTSDILFPQWQTCEYEVVPEDQCNQYLPILNESCKVKCSDSEWVTFQKFESKIFEGSQSIFVGGSIQCLSWVPQHVDGESDEFVAITGHRGADSPRYEPDQLCVYKSLIQIWEIGFLNGKGDGIKFAMGIALDYGAVWAMDWCPSGTRNLLPESKEDTVNFVRMGLLAVACSNGLAYIFSVPYPSSVTNSDQQIYKLKPVAELRFVMGTDRTKYQASSICWSKQKGHNTIIVGYANGSCAYFDLSTDSSLLRAVEDGVTILYPFHDERSLKSCVTNITTCATAGHMGRDAVALCGPTGAALLTPANIAPPRQELHLAYSSVAFVPGWPTLIVAGDEATMNKSANELELWGCGRRLGLMQVCCGCERCGVSVAYMAPILRAMKPYPPHGDMNKRPLAMLRMKKINGRKRKYVKDELALELEPITYEAAVQKYGIEMTFVSNKNKNEYHQRMMNAKDVFPERFPLSDVVSLAFCPTAKNHRILAVATHAGVVFFIHV